MRLAESRGSLISTDSGNSLSEKNNDKSNSLDKVEPQECACRVTTHVQSVAQTCDKIPSESHPLVNLTPPPLHCPCGWPWQTDGFVRRHSVNVRRYFAEKEELPSRTKRVTMDFSLLSVPCGPQSALRPSISLQVKRDPPPPSPLGVSHLGVLVCVCVGGGGAGS